jgi:hypothetical protein
MQSPLAIVKERFGDKAKLVAELEKLAGEDLWVSRTNERKGLAHVSNAKLLRLHRIFSEVKEQFGTRDKLIAAILELEKRTKDEGYRARLAKFPVPRLFDHYRSAHKRARRADTAKKAVEPKKKAAPKKAEARTEEAAAPNKRAAATPQKEKAAKA